MSVRVKLWTREEYDRLVAAGAFQPETRAQLIQGEIVEMVPQSAAHAAISFAMGEGLDCRPDYNEAGSGYVISRSRKLAKNSRRRTSRR